MANLKDFVNENRTSLWCVFGLLLILVLVLFPVTKLTWEERETYHIWSSFVLITDEKGLGFSKLLLYLMLLAPVCLIATSALKIKALEPLKGKLPIIHCALCFVLGLLFMMTLKDKMGDSEYSTITMKAGFGIYIYFLIGLVGAAIGYAADNK